MSEVETGELLAEVQALIREREQEGVRGLAERIGPSEWADLVPQLEPAEVAVLIQWLPDEEVPALLEELPPAEAARILRTLSQPEAAQLLEGMDPDDAADIIENLPDTTADEILVRMRAEDAAEIRELAAYEPDTAGGLMTPAFVAVEADVTSEQALAAIRRLVDEAETVNYVYVVDGDRHLLGVLSLYRLLLSPTETRVRELMAPDTVRVRASADQEAAARLLTDRNLLAIPVVDDEDHLLGIITEDDVADVLQAEATEDIERLGGSQPLNLPYRLASVAPAGPEARVLAAPALRRGGLHRHRAPELPETSSRRWSRSPSSSRSSSAPAATSGARPSPSSYGPWRSTRSPSGISGGSSSRRCAWVSCWAWSWP